jgi:mono/diheme cytochrome c family protein
VSHPCRSNTAAHCPLNIEGRTDLANVDVLIAFLRAGAGSMPPFPKTEITDEDIAAVAAYFADTSADCNH